jgi:hypothetical protein
MKAFLAPLLALAALLSGAQASAQETRTLDALLTQDVRLATIAERMLTANAPLCRQLMPVTGVILHSRDQYRNGSEGDAFGNGPVAVAAVVPGSPAAAALAPRDALVRIGSTPTAGMTGSEGAPARDTAFAALATAPSEGPVTLVIVRDGREQAVSLPATPGCRALVEIRAENQLNARSDGRVIQVNYGLAVRATDDELAVAFAHEFAHLVLEHRRRLEAAGVEKGFFGEFGRNQNLNRLVEVEADRMTVHLLANAGYDPRIAPAFWRSDLGKSTAGGIFRSRTYPSAESRAGLGEREIANYLGGGTGPSWPGHLLARRDVPF